MANSSSPLNRRAMLRTLTVGAAVAAIATTLGCSTAKHNKQPQGVGTSSAATPAAPGTLVMIIRHGEKPDSFNPGVDISGNPADDHALTQIGWNRARALVELFAPSNGQLRPGLAPPKLIYAAGVTDAGEGQRTRETITPLAQRLGISANTSFGKGDENAMVAQIVSQPGPTLICWQHGEIPSIAEAFGSLTPTPPRTWPDDRADVIWTLTANTAGGWDFAQIPELVLPQDQPQTIAS